VHGKLPTAQDLEKLPIRAIAAYTSRIAHRVSGQLRGLVPDQVLDCVLDRTEMAWRAPFLHDVDAALLMSAIAALHGAISGVRHTPEAGLAIVAVSRSATIAYWLVQANDDPLRILYYVRRAAKMAEKVVSIIDTLYVGESHAKKAAIQDYRRLIDNYAVDDEVTISDLVDCFDDEYLDNE
jgi:hypothetical protein